jgi:undecaprenyl diphosphate synthase
MGHQAGTDNIRQITECAAKLGINYLTLWAFSTENWSRPKDEVDGILAILAETLPREIEELDRKGARLKHIGTLDGLDESLKRQINDAILRTQDNDRITLTLAFNYGGRYDILQAARRMIEDNVGAEQVSDAMLGKYLLTADIPDPDLIIRTSGEMRISNFFLWQAAFSEFIFTPVLWPDFDDAELSTAVRDYQGRERRFGGLVDRVSSEQARL